MANRQLDSWMWAEACGLIGRVERVRYQFFQLTGSRSRAPCWEPPVDILELRDTLEVSIAMPGIEADQIHVNLDTATLIIAAFRPVPIMERGTEIHRLEIPHGRFERLIALPRGRFELLSQDVTCGCVHIRLRRL